MKKSLLILPLFLSSFLNAQVPSSCIVPPDLATVYHKDIVQLATNYLFQVQSPDTILVHPPQQTIDEISGGLAAILNASSIPERDSVFNLYCVHNLNGWPYDYAGFLVRVDTSYAWTQAWQNLVTVTGNAYVDSLTSQYALHITNFYNWSIGNYAELSVDSAWNIMALMDSISYAAGVISAELNGLIGQAGWIEYLKSGSDRYYDFYFEFNDCFDGCDNYHQWRFKVDTACAVSYLGFTDWGVFGISPLPAPVNCNTFTEIKDDDANRLVLFPNPASTRLILQNIFSTLHSVHIFNSVGQEISVQQFSSGGNVVLDVSTLPRGIYFLEAACDEKIFHEKFLRN